MSGRLPVWGQLCVLCVVAPLLGWAQKPTVIPLIPAADWRLVKLQTLGLDAVRQFGGDPVIDREYGVKGVELRTYRLGNSTAYVLLEESPDISNAYALLTCYQTEEMAPEKDMQLTLSGPQGALMERGRFLIRVSRPAGMGSEISDNDYRALLILIAGTRPASDTVAKLPVAMPPNGMIKGSEKYLLGPESARRALPGLPADLIGFSQGAEVEAASYKTGNARPTLVAITYPTPQIARVRFGAMEHFLALNQDHGSGSIYGRRSRSFVFLVLGATSADKAAQLLNRLEVSQSVSWNEKYPGDESIWMQAGKLILASLILVSILAGLAAVGGLMIFLSRKMAAKFFPGSTWGRAEEGSIIRLNLS